MTISIRPGYTAEEVLGYLKEAERGAANFLGQGGPALADLDRGLVIDTLNDPDLGYFSGVFLD